MEGARILLVEDDPRVRTATVGALEDLGYEPIACSGGSEALALFDRIFEYLEMESDITDAPDALVLDPAAMRGEVRFEHVTFRYPVAPAQV